ncbi:retrovirus-related pol polyprotein from transposon TNT 1-94 [Tanacetum coccineum]
MGVVWCCVEFVFGLRCGDGWCGFWGCVEWCGTYQLMGWNGLDGGGRWYAGVLVVHVGLENGGGNWDGVGLLWGGGLGWGGISLVRVGSEAEMRRVRARCRLDRIDKESPRWRFVIKGGGDAKRKGGGDYSGNGGGDLSGGIYQWIFTNGIIPASSEQVRNQVPVYVAEGLILERQKAKEETERLIAKAILQERGNIQAQISTQIENAIANVIPSQVDASVRNYMSGHILHVHPAQSQTSSVPEQQYQLYLAMKVDPQLQQQDIEIWLFLDEGLERNTVHTKTAVELLVIIWTSFSRGTRSSTSRNQEQDDDLIFGNDSYVSSMIDENHEQVSQDIMKEVSLIIDEAKLRKMVDEMLRRDVYLQEKEILVSPHPRKTTPLVHNCQKDPEAPPLSLINQDLLYLKKGNYGPEKIVLSLHKFPAIIFNDDDIEERTSRWVNNQLSSLMHDIEERLPRWVKVYKASLILMHDMVLKTGRILMRRSSTYGARNDPGKIEGRNLFNSKDRSMMFSDMGSSWHKIFNLEFDSLSNKKDLILNYNQNERRSTFKKGVICGNCSKEGHYSEECYKIVGYPVGHPLHGKFKPNAQKNNTPRTVNMTQIADGPVAESAQPDDVNDAAKLKGTKWCWDI